ncbi:MAG: hypothetical protein EOM48_05005 [Bacilli bacterium]|nr:hypothetical protein [Bacilli bacterium]
MFESALELVKARLGITSTARDVYLKAVISGVVSELSGIRGITINENIPAHLMFVVDYAEWRYSSRENPVMPRYLQSAMHNLMISSGGA